MVVDDEPAMRDALELALRLDGFDVELASDGRDAIRRLPVVRPDVVLLDVLMLELDGIEVCRRMRDVGDRTPVLMLTARDEVSCSRACARCCGAAAAIRAIRLSPTEALRAS